MYPLALNVQAALAGVPPVLLFVVVQPAGVPAPLKFSFNNVVAVFEFDVALDVRFTVLPAQIVDALDEAVTLVGEALTAIVPEATTQPGVIGIE